MRSTLEEEEASKEAGSDVQPIKSSKPGRPRKPAPVPCACVLYRVVVCVGVWQCGCNKLL